MGLWTKGESLLPGIADASSSFQCIYTYHSREEAHDQGYSSRRSSSLLYLQYDGYTVGPFVRSQLMIGTM
jgi:hypothetical protein